MAFLLDFVWTHFRYEKKMTFCFYEQFGSMGLIIKSCETKYKFPLTVLRLGNCENFRNESQVFVNLKYLFKTIPF